MTSEQTNDMYERTRRIVMLKGTKAFSSFSVDDLKKAEEFYAQRLGLSVSKSSEGLEIKIAKSNPIFIYPKPNHTPASFTVLNFSVKDIEQAVDDLASKGISFEHYGGEIATDEKGIHHNGGPKIAWFKDPAGNILSVLEDK